MRRLMMLATAAAVPVLLVPATALAQASAPAARPAAVFAFKDSKVTHGAKPVLTYKTSHLPRGSVISLQRQFGSASVWKNVEKLSARSGTVTAPGDPIGKYDYRIRVTKSGKTVVTSATHPLYSYGRVTLETLCATYTDLDCTPQTVQIGTSILTYVIDGGFGYPSYQAVLKLSSTSCSSLSTQYGTNSSTGDAYIEVIQASADPQYGSAPTQTIASFKAQLDGGAFYLEISSSGGNYVFVNGTAHCYTRTGAP